MRVLIVGCGYVGLPLGAELARRGHAVSGLRRSAAAELRAAGIEPLPADVTRAETLRNLRRDFDWVVNCAASGGGSAEDYRQLYLEGNRNLVSWLGESALEEIRLYQQHQRLWPKRRLGGDRRKSGEPRGACGQGIGGNGSVSAGRWRALVFLRLFCAWPEFMVPGAATLPEFWRAKRASRAKVRVT